METKDLLEQEKKSHKLNKQEEKEAKSLQAQSSKALKKRESRYQKLRKLAKKRKAKKELKKMMAPIKAEKRARREYYRSLSNPPVRPVLEEIGNAVTHGVGALLAIAALTFLLLSSTSTLEILASCVYGICMFIMMLMSCLYHSFKSGSRVKRIWRRFDYSSIYLLIGGTFAPIYLVYLGNTLGITLFIVQWFFIIVGITFVAVFGPGRFKPFHYTMYFAIGWSGLMFIPDFIKNNINLLWMILLGGLAYTIGMIPFAKKGSKCAHFIWHFFVLVGALVQYLGILFYIY